MPDTRSLASFPLRAHEGDHGTLLVASHDRLAFLYTPEATHLLLQTAADRIGGTLMTHDLVETLEETNRTLQAVGRFAEAIEKPGASQQQVLQAVATRLTDPMIPEFHFDVAAAYLLAHSNHHGAWVRLAAGDTAAASADVYGTNPDYSNGTGECTPKFTAYSRASLGWYPRAYSGFPRHTILCGQLSAASSWSPHVTMS